MMTNATVVITTYNRKGMLREAVDSALSQDCQTYRVVVLDDHSTDGTEEEMRTLRDGRLEYVRNANNLGQIRNWNRAFTLADTDYVVLLQDDDRLQPGFLGTAIAALDEYPDAAFAYGLAETIDMDGHIVSSQSPPSLGTGLTDGRAYLKSVVSGENWIMHISGALWQREALPAGLFDASHSRHTIDFNLFYRRLRCSTL
jgi:glycosyltransferase involved in cell wall biosynthesis